MIQTTQEREEQLKNLSKILDRLIQIAKPTAKEIVNIDEQKKELFTEIKAWPEYVEMTFGLDGDTAVVMFRLDLKNPDLQKFIKEERL